MPGFSTLNRVEHKFYTHSTSSYVLWNDEGGFRWEKLPVEAQVSPIKKSIIKDFNQDGYPDVLLAGINRGSVVTYSVNW